jgi:hypothetical protein
VEDNYGVSEASKLLVEDKNKNQEDAVSSVGW